MTAVMARQPAAFQLSQSLQKSYTHPSFRRLAPRPHAARSHRGRPPRPTPARRQGGRERGVSVSGGDEAYAGLRPGYAGLAEALIRGLAADARVQCVLVTGPLATGLLNLKCLTDPQPGSEKTCSRQ